MASDVDYWQVHQMVENEASDRRQADRDLRELVGMRAREANESLSDLQDQIRQLREGLRTLDAMRLDNA
jgi:hypothetical protein